MEMQILERVVNKYMNTLSVAMITRKCGSILRDVLVPAAKYADEIVIVDTEPGGSQDGTKEIADEVGAKIIYFDWCDDFSAARNLSFRETIGTHILTLDSDDIVPEVTWRAIRELIDSGEINNFSGVSIPYQIFSSNGVVSQSYNRERIISRKVYDEGAIWIGAVHECFALPQPILKLEHPIEHRPRNGKFEESGRNLRILEKLYQKDPENFLPREQLYRSRELYWNGRYAEAIVSFERWLLTGPVHWERYSANLELGQCYYNLGNEQEYVKILMELIVNVPERAEAFVALGLLYYWKREYNRAAPFFAAATACVRPKEGFITEGDYGPKVWDFYAVSLGWMGQYEEAKRITTDILIPHGFDVERNLENVKFYNRMLGLDEEL